MMVLKNVYGSHQPGPSVPLLKIFSFIMKDKGGTEGF
jgi:hypothetical protein